MRDRLIDFERVANFRDFGSYETADGRRLARGMLFRSAAFHNASENDMARLEKLGVRFLVDLRRPEERAHEPNRWPGENLRSIANDEGGAASLPPHLMALLQSDLTADSVARFMRDIYRGFAFEPRHVALYRSWFHELARGGPGVIHCAAGKDRTGLGCALTLLALGVGEDDVFADYLFTNEAVDVEERLPRIQAQIEERLSRKLDAAALRPMLRVAPDYLRGALDEIETQCGSIDAYLQRVLGVGAPERAVLKDKLSA